MYGCPPKPPKKIHKEGVRLKREEMLSVHDARRAFKAVVPKPVRHRSNFRAQVGARVKID